MIDFVKLRQDLEDTYLQMYTNGCGAALVEIARIHIASEEELIDFVNKKGLNLQQWEN